MPVALRHPCAPPLCWQTTRGSESRLQEAFRVLASEGDSAQRGLTQERFAETLGMSVDFLSLIERGRNSPSFDTIERISKRLKMPVAQLVKFGR
jgi:DNA-binding XRE family transcriptional regulator